MADQVEKPETEETDAARGDDDMPDEADYYAVLGVGPNASHEEIRAAYRRLAKLWHPDRYSFATDDLRQRAERRMRAISRAWSELGDPLRRRAYDQRRPGSAWTPGWSPGPWQSRGETLPADGNGAGIFAGMLCVILALPLVINLLNGNLHESWQTLIAVVLVLILGGLAGMFFTNETTLAKAATHWAEGEPRGFYDQTMTTHTHASPGFTVDDLGPYDTAADDEEQEHVRVFDVLVEQALQTIPNEFKPYMENVLVRVEREPSEETLRQAKVHAGSTLLGLYTGSPLTAHGAQPHGTEFVTIYRGPIERYCHGDAERIREQVRRTVLHEVAHHFGIDHDEMPDYLK